MNLTHYVSKQYMGYLGQQIDCPSPRLHQVSSLGEAGHPCHQQRKCFGDFGILGMYSHSLISCFHSLSCISDWSIPHPPGCLQGAVATTWNALLGVSVIQFWTFDPHNTSLFPYAPFTLVAFLEIPTLLLTRGPKAPLLHNGVSEWVCPQSVGLVPASGLSTCPVCLWARLMHQNTALGRSPCRTVCLFSDKVFSSTKLAGPFQNCKQYVNLVIKMWVSRIYQLPKYLFTDFYELFNLQDAHRFTF